MIDMNYFNLQYPRALAAFAVEKYSVGGSNQSAGGFNTQSSLSR